MDRTLTWSWDCLEAGDFYAQIRDWRERITGTMMSDEWAGVWYIVSLRQGFEKIVTVNVIQVDILSAIAAAHHMINGAGILNAHFGGSRSRLDPFPFPWGDKGYVPSAMQAADAVNRKPEDRNPKSEVGGQD